MRAGGGLAGAFRAWHDSSMGQGAVLGRWSTTRTVRSSVERELEGLARRTGATRVALRTGRHGVLTWPGPWPGLMPSLAGDRGSGAGPLGFQTSRAEDDDLEFHLWHSATHGRAREALEVARLRVRNLLRQEREGPLLERGRQAGVLMHELRNRVGGLLLLGEQASVLGQGVDGLLGDLRDLSGVASRGLGGGDLGASPETLTRVDLGDLVRDALSRAEPVLRVGAADLPESPTTKWGEVLADRAGTVDLLANLLGNAAEAAGRGGAVQLNVERVGDAGLAVVLRNSGHPIPREAFLPGWTRGGTGSGLAGASDLVRRMGAWLEVRSDGGVVQFLLALLRADLPLARVRLDPRLRDAAPGVLSTASPQCAARWLRILAPHMATELDAFPGWAPR